MSSSVVTAFIRPRQGLYAEGYLPEAITCGEVIAGCRSSIRDIFVSRGTTQGGTGHHRWYFRYCLLAYAWFMNHRPALHIKSEWTLQDTLIQNSGSDAVLLVFARIGVAVLSGL